VVVGDEWWELGCGDQPNKRIFLAKRMLFPKTISPHKQRLAQIKVAVDSNLNPTLPMKYKNNSSKPKTCKNVSKNKIEVVVAFQMA
jgi:hypothetical protein